MIVDENEAARLRAVDDDMHMNVALESTVFSTRPIVPPSGFGTQFYTGQVHKKIWPSERVLEMN